MSGRTTWWPCDAAEHDRELVVELGEEFGPAAHAITRVLKDLAQQQRDSGAVRTGFRVLASKCHLSVGSTPDTGRALARAVVEMAGEIGWLDDLEIDEDGRRFACRVSGWQADQARGREAIKKADQRERDKGGHVPPEGDKSTADEDESGSVPPTREDQNREDQKDPAATPPGARAPDQTSRSIAETVKCPRCASEAGAKCMGVRGPRESCHLERHHAVGELPHLTVKNGDRRRSQPETRSPERRASDADRQQREQEFCSHFPDVHRSIVMVAVRAVNDAGEPATVDAVRAHLEAVAS